MSVSPAHGGTVAVRIEAPCHPSAAVVVHHGQVSATFLSTSSGVVAVLFPAFDEIARYDARLSDDSLLSAVTYVPGARSYEHMVTMWEGNMPLSVHAFEYGADAGDAGHVWYGAPRSPAVAETGRGGYLLKLGTERLPNARQAEVYSFPVDEAARSGTVRIALGAEITPTTCGTELKAVTLQLGRDLPGAPVDVNLSLPECDHVGDYMLLKNLARDLKIVGQ